MKVNLIECREHITELMAAERMTLNSISGMRMANAFWQGVISVGGSNDNVYITIMILSGRVKELTEGVN
jgi:hypothetical protein